MASGIFYSPFATPHSLFALYGLIAILVARPGVRSGSARRANSHSSERVLRGSMISSTQNFSAERNGERGLFRRALPPPCFLSGAGPPAPRSHAEALLAAPRRRAAPP